MTLPLGNPIDLDDQVAQNTEEMEHRNPRLIEIRDAQ